MPAKKKPAKKKKPATKKKKAAKKSTSKPKSSPKTKSKAKSKKAATKAAKKVAAKKKKEAEVEENYFTLTKKIDDIPSGAIVSVLGEHKGKKRIAIAKPLDFRGEILEVDPKVVSDKKITKTEAKKIRGLYEKIRNTAMAQINPLTVAPGTIVPVPRPNGYNAYYEVTKIQKSNDIEKDDLCELKYRRDLHPLLLDPPEDLGEKAERELKSVYVLLVNADTAIRGETIGTTSKPDESVTANREVVSMDDAVAEHFSVDQ